jgi:UDP-N-acetylmuramoylalanine--D-glutamate ligase
MESTQMDGQAKNLETLEAYLDRRVLVVGAARSGIAVTEFLLARGARVILTDTRSLEALGTALQPALRIAQSSGELQLELGGHNPESFRNCDFVVVSPGVPLALPYFEESRRAGIPVMAEVEFAFRHLRGRILGITGSNGKTTTTALVAELLRGSGLKGHAAGNIGIPLIGYAAASSPDDLYSTELSSFQLEGILQMRPWVGSILNLTPDHLDRYSGFEHYIAAKKRIFMNQEKEDFAVLNADDPRTFSLAAEVKSAPVLFSRQNPVARGTFLRDGDFFWRNEDRERWLFGREDIRIRGNHNLENVLAACAIAMLAGVRPETMREVVQNFKGVEHRIEWVAEIDGVQYFNDSKATNVDATIKSLESFPGDIHLIAGGKDKGGDFAALRELVRDRVKHLVLIGEAAGKLREVLADLVETTEEPSLESAVLHCRRHALPGDFVLLAPACASFDMFENYEHRGRVFKKTVTELQERS